MAAFSRVAWSARARRSAGSSRVESIVCRSARPDSPTASMASLAPGALVADRMLKPQPRTARAVGTAPRQIRMSRILLSKESRITLRNAQVTVAAYGALVAVGADDDWRSEPAGQSQQTTRRFRPPA